ncbi:MAG TPA: hypothetical protein VKS44_15875 [Candidatus Acidoferrales bacterium]|nr:hypothetical protein [Candidatus Acidoferrales bacterium]
MRVMVHHRLYGLLLASSRALPGIPILSNPDRAPDLNVYLKSTSSPLLASRPVTEPFYVSAAEDENGDPILWVASLDDGQHLVMRYSDGTRFAINLRANEVFVDWPDPLTLQDAASYLVGPVLGLVLRLRGTVPLHASAVAIGDHAVALAGPAGAGKSTTAAAFTKYGYRVISDDIVALLEEESRFVVPSGYPRVNLWNDSVEGVVGNEVTLPRICPTVDKCFLPLDPFTQFETRSLPLAAIYVLHSHKGGPVPPVLEPLAGAEALIGVLSNTYMNHLPDLEKRRREFELLGRVVARVPIRRVHACADLSMLPALCETIAGDATDLVPIGSRSL